MKIKIAIYLSFLLSSFTSIAQQTIDKNKPNIIFILMDDMGYGDLGSFFQNNRKQQNDRSEPWLVTPMLDKMAAEGATLSSQYCAAPVCAPSRASLLLGVSQGHANVRNNQFDKALEDNYTLANMLKNNGYATAAIGKWGLQGKGKGPDWPAHPLKRGFDYYYGYIKHGDGHEHYPKEGLHRGPKEVWENYTEVSADLDKCYTGDLFTAVAKKYIIAHQKSKETKKPFFMYLAYDTPHAVLELPTQAYPNGAGLEGGMQWLGKKGEMINTASGKIDSYVYPEYADATYDDDSNPDTPEVPWPETYKRYASVNHRIDDQIGDIIQLLKDLKIDDNTLVVFTSDNGPSKESYLPKEKYVEYKPTFFNNFGPFDGIKRDVLEGGVREPTIVWWPGKITPDTVVKTPSISYDWMPTFAEAVGFKAPVRSDGVSLLPSLTGMGEQEDSKIYVEYFHNRATPNYEEFTSEHRNKKRKQMQMLRIGDKVGLRYNILSAAQDFEIYDIVKDPKQQNNLAKSEPLLQELMKNKVLQMRKVDSSSIRPYDNEYIPATKAKETKKGLLQKLFLVNESWIPQTNTLTPLLVNTVDKPKGDMKEGNLAVFEGYINVPADDNYTFYLTANHKAFLRIHEVSVIDADYMYTPNQEKQEVLKLKKGLHPIKLYYLNPKSAKTKPKLSLKWSYKGKSKEEISPNSFFNQ
jgi:arylsulfatase A-like enzyme